MYPYAPNTPNKLYCLQLYTVRQGLLLWDLLLILIPLCDARV